MASAGAQATVCGNVVVGDAGMVEETGRCFDVDPASSACGRSFSAAVGGVLVSSVCDTCRSVATVGSYGDTRVDHDLVPFEVDGAARSASSTAAGLVHTWSTLSTTGPNITSDGQGTAGHDLEGAAAASTLSFISSSTAGTREEMIQVFVTVSIA